jgi:hypothetical protein
MIPAEEAVLRHGRDHRSQLQRHLYKQKSAKSPEFALFA